MFTLIFTVFILGGDPYRGTAGQIHGFATLADCEQAIPLVLSTPTASDGKHRIEAHCAVSVAR